jgi:hypothetical protein|tara:strand:- start:447 stop:683 length:237 start_codon:yes stop_codon:yes gene_type:complete
MNMYKLTWQKKAGDIWLPKQFVMGSIADTHDCYSALIDGKWASPRWGKALEIRAIITKIEPSGGKEVVAYDYEWGDWT